jgi:hypothetical protein
MEVLVAVDGGGVQVDTLTAAQFSPQVMCEGGGWGSMVCRRLLTRNSLGKGGP